MPSNFCLIRIFEPKIRFGGYIYSLLVAIRLALGRYDLVFSRNLLCSIFAIRFSQRHILEIHQPIVKSSRFQRQAFDKLIMRSNFQGLVVITKPLKQIYLNEFGVPEEKIIVAADGADIPSEKSVFNSPSTNRLQIGYLGHLYKGRGIELIIDVARNCIWADFHIVGGNPSDISRVKDLVSNDENIHIHGFIPPQKAEQFRFKMDVLLAPYQEKVGLESGSMTTEKWMSPLKIFEYMAAGKAVVASDIPVLREVLVNMENSILCQPGDKGEWVRVLKQLRDDPGLRKCLGNRAIEDIRNRFSWDQRVKRILGMGIF